jgi:aminoglycoside phosphotransferase (APT) family kinase protein
MEHVDGLIVDDMAIARGLPPERRRAIGLALPRALAAVHAVDLERTGLADLASHKPYATRQLKRWHGQWERSRTRELPAIDDLAGRLWAAAPEQRELTLVHGDFHLLNVIVAPGDDSVRAILDWELCTLGDPLADLGGLLAYWPRPGDPAAAVPGDPAEALFAASTLAGFPSRAELVAVYADLTGRTLDELGFWHVLGLWKIAIIAEGVLRRVRDEPRNASASASKMALAGLVDHMVARAEAVAAEVGL